MRTAIYPGTFDPVTRGHLDIIARAAQMFDRVVVTVAVNSAKSPMFTTDERLTLVRAAVKEARLPNVTAEAFSGLLVNFARKKKASALIRGLRAVSDFEYEFQMALMNRKLAPKITTVFLMPHEKYTYLNSSIVREVARLGGDVTDLVPAAVARALQQKLKHR
ncbi:MAG: pantetheine-phosphate adenylyltransferase [Bacteroidetes bacterium]|nr:MAG: pantetheine-phosphate adenylyltransferase [Bacteroidota bacterium]